jgi:hypothetical protein
MVIAGIGKPMMKDRYSRNTARLVATNWRRYAYYCRCQVFRKSGEQCKAPAEKGASICYAYAGQRAMALRRERERQAVLAEAVAEMRRTGRPDFEMADLFMDFKSIQVTLAVMARALIHWRIDCKTAGRLMVQLQTMSKLLWMQNKKAKPLPQINTDSTGLKNRAITEKPILTMVAWKHSSHQASTGLARDHEETGLRTKVVAISTGNAADRNAKIVAIRSAKQVPSPFHPLERHGSGPTFLTG